MTKSNPNRSHTDFSNKAIADLLRFIASAYVLKNENRFKVIAYENAAGTVEHMSRELKDIWQEGSLTGIPGIGPSIASHLDEYFKTGISKHFEEVLKDIPAPVFELMQIPSIGPKKAFKLVTALKLEKSPNILKDLAHAAKTGKIATIATFGEDSQKAIGEAVALFAQREKGEKRMPLSFAFSMAQELTDYLKKHPAVKRVDALGSLRRMVTTIGDIDLAVPAADDQAQSIIDHFLKYPGLLKVENKGDKKASIIITPQIRVDLRVQDPDTYGSMLQYFIGGKTHNVKLREYGIKKGLSLNEYGILDTKTKKRHTFDTEEKFYHFLGLQYVPPEIREGTNEVALAQKHQLPDLVALKDIKGDFHTHSSYDLKPSHDLGANTYEEMMEKRKQLGYDYIGFSEHNPKVSGLTKDEIITIMKRRKDYIDKILLTKKVDQSHYFIGLEADIQPSGELALPIEAIDYVDYLIVSVHSSFQMNIDDMTKRVLKALSYPKVKILGHPTGRLLGKREGFELHWDEIFSYAQKHNIALEINSSPDRLDLPDSLVRRAVEKGVKLTIDSDAHAVAHMDILLYGVSVARRGWAQKSDIINTLPYKEVKKWIEK